MRRGETIRCIYYPLPLSLFRYLSAVDALYDRYLEISPPNSTLIINTMGWIESFGRDVLNHVCQVGRPSCPLSPSLFFRKYILVTFFVSLVVMKCPLQCINYHFLSLIIFVKSQLDGGLITTEESEFSSFCLFYFLISIQIASLCC